MEQGKLLLPNSMYYIFEKEPSNNPIKINFKTILADTHAWQRVFLTLVISFLWKMIHNFDRIYNVWEIGTFWGQTLRTCLALNIRYEMVEPKNATK